MIMSSLLESLNLSHDICWPKGMGGSYMKVLVYPTLAALLAVAIWVACMHFFMSHTNSLTFIGFNVLYFWRQTRGSK